MKNLLSALIRDTDHTAFKEFISFASDSNSGMMLRNAIMQMFRNYCQAYDKPASFQETSSVFAFIKKAQELFPVDDHQAILHRGVAAGVRIDRFDLVEPRLHEIFVRHAGEPNNGVGVGGSPASDGRGVAP